VGIAAFGCGGAVAPNRLFGESCLGPSGRTQDKLREFSRHLIRGVGGGTRKRMAGFFAILWRDADRRKWFWVLLPKQKDLVGGGETPQLPETPNKFTITLKA